MVDVTFVAARLWRGPAIQPARFRAWTGDPKEMAFMKTRSALVASAAAAMFVTGLAGAAHAEESGGAAKIKCEGVNSCKGHSDCNSAKNDCKGKNDCAGKGFMMMSKAECDAAKAKAKAAEKSKKM